MKTVLLALLRVYKAAVSPYMPGMCRYQPSCSEYAASAVQRFGAARGSVMAVRRLTRCHPWHAGGYDPVPELK